MAEKKLRKLEQWQDMIARLYPEYIPKGEERVLSRTVTFQVTDACNLACKYCLDGDTLIRMADYSLKPIKDIEIGDNILGFDEYPEKWKQTKVNVAVVEQKFIHTDKLIEVEFETGEKIKITKNHKVLVRRNSSMNHTCDFVPIGNLKVGRSVYRLPILDSQLELFNVNFDDDYKLGYLVSVLKGDGSLKHYNRKSDGCDVFKFRFAVKDIEIIDRVKEYLDYFGIDTYIKKYVVSKKYNLKQDAIFANTRKTYNAINKIYDDNFLKNTSLSYYQGFLAGIYDAEGHISDQRVIRICNTDYDIIQEIIRGMEKLNIPYTIEEDNRGTKNKDCKWNMRISDNLDAISSYRFIKSICPALPRKSFEKFLHYSPLKKTKIKSIKELDEEVPVYNIGTSSHTYIANGIAVHNCYQINKGKRKMSFDTAKKFIDLLLSGEKGFAEYINPEISPAIILEFIGGEPFLEVELIDKIVDYFREQTIELMHPWATNYCISICSNGVLYFDDKVQKFLNKNKDHMSFSITIDGNKALHDSCRIFPDGRPSYDIAVAGANDWIAKGNYMGSKITIAPGNITYLYDAIIHMVKLGYLDINANCVYEKGWEKEHAVEFYKQLKDVADYFLNNDLVGEIYCSLFEESFFKPKSENDLQNWCGGNGFMLSCDPDGYLYPCIRYMESSLGDSRAPMRIGSVFDGLGHNECHRDCIRCLKSIDRRTQSTNECFYCPIGEGCSWCSANNYQETGTPNKRVTHICEMHKARALANTYLWNMYYKKNNIDKKFKMHCPKEWALNIISEEEYDMLSDISG